MPDEKPGTSPTGDPIDQAAAQSAAIAAIEQRVVALESKSAANQKSEPSKDILNYVRSGERWLIGINGLLLLATIVVATIYYGQLEQMRKATVASTDAVRIANDSLLYSSANFDRQMGQSIDQGATQYDSLQTAINQSHQDQRAWLAVEDVHGPIEQPIMRFTNTGHTPAINTIVYGHTSYLPPGYEFVFKAKFDPKRLGVVSPQTERTANGPRVTVTADMSKGSHLYSYGLITYDDIFDASHWITFCMRLNAEGTGYEFCEQNNDAGDGTYKGQ